MQKFIEFLISVMLYSAVTGTIKHDGAISCGPARAGPGARLRGYALSKHRHSNEEKSMQPSVARPRWICALPAQTKLHNANFHMLA
jgi:hypothetical protein